ncbi:a-factor receptor [Marasmius tenuissimus]|uniref:A-factor receptor n=1 Tax=Marasmius tenuissimus TaxID=585030 RepID=A0ABR2ZFN2_9AGAR|nr:a-factor receptor [Marasmius tenuissimus]
MAISKDPTYPLFPILTGLGFLLCLIPLPWHIQAMNSGTVAFMLWTATLCLVYFVNSIVWAGSVANVAPVWCDISVQVILGAAIGIPASTLCISRRLYRITSIRSVSLSRADKKRAIIEDVCIAAGIPAIVLALHTIVHAHRFDILEDIGCHPVTYNTLPAYFLYFMWPIVLGAISFVYSCLNLYSFYIRRAQFAQFMSSNSAMNMSRYLRLMILSIVDILFTIPLGSYVVYIATHNVILKPWISWEDTHFNWLRVVPIPALIWRNDESFQISVELNRWLSVLCAFLFFALFGFASEAKKNYKIAFWWCMKFFGIRPTNTGKGRVQLPKVKPPATNDSLPMYMQNIKIPTLATTTTASSADATHVESFTPTDKKAGGSLPPSSPSSPVPPPYTQHSQYRGDDQLDLSDVSSLSSYASSGSFASLADTENARNSTYTVEVSISNTIYPASFNGTENLDVPASPTTPMTPIHPDTSRSPSPVSYTGPHTNLSAGSQNLDRTRTPTPIPTGPPAALLAVSSDPAQRVYLAEAYPSSRVPLARPSPPPFNELTFQSFSANPTHSTLRDTTRDAPIVITVHKSSDSL